MSDLNKVILIGRLTKDPELRYTPNGASVASFGLASNYTYTKNGEKKEQVSFFNCTAWGKQAEAIVEYVKKGHRFQVTGRLQQRSWEDQNGNKRSAVEIVVEEFQFLHPREGAPKDQPVKDQPNFDDLPPATTDDGCPF